MKRWVPVFLLLVVLPVAAYAQLPPVGYMGLFTNSIHSWWCVDGAGFYSAEMWVWCLPGDGGMICVEFALGYPGNVIQSTITLSPLIFPPEVFDPEIGVTLCYSTCQVAWTWIFHQTLWVTTAEQTHVALVKHTNPLIEDIQIATCEAGYPVEPVRKFSDFYINYPPEECPGNAVESESWGAIKSLMAE
jgi:hypothetical protein